jgi:LemA protein
MSGILFALCLVIFIFGAYVIAIFNGLVSRKNAYRNAFSQIDVQLERRYDLIPNLVETAKKYMSHERETLEAVVRARNEAHAACKQASKNVSNPEAMTRLSETEQTLSQTLGRFMMLTESYPELKASDVMKPLMEELTHSENNIAFARQAFNDSVMSYNTAREQFPANLFAAGFGFSEATFLCLKSDEKRSTPQVKFN